MLSKLGLFFTVLLVGTGAYAQDARVDPRVNEAKTACAAGDVQKAVRLLAELYTATNDPIWIFNQGRCYHQNNQLPLAVARFKEFLRKNVKGPAEDSRDAQNYINEIEAEIHKDDAKPGATTGTTTGIAKGRDETRDYSKGRGLRYAGIGCGILGGAALASGIVFSLLTSKTGQDVENQTKNDVVQASAVSGKLSDGKLYEALQWVGYGVGAASVMTGVVLYYVGLKRAEVQSPGTTAMLFPIMTAGGGGAAVHLSF
jgi:hypothetical protein